MYQGDMYYENMTNHDWLEGDPIAEVVMDDSEEELPQITPEELAKLPEDELQDLFKDDLDGDEDDIAQ
jgi:hypothetical protein